MASSLQDESALEAEIHKLEQEIEKKRLEEQISLLEMQLHRAKPEAQRPNAPSNPSVVGQSTSTSRTSSPRSLEHMLPTQNVSWSGANGQSPEDDSIIALATQDSEGVEYDEEDYDEEECDENEYEEVFEEFVEYVTDDEEEEVGEQPLESVEEYEKVERKRKSKQAPVSPSRAPPRQWPPPARPVNDEHVVQYVAPKKNTEAPEEPKQVAKPRKKWVPLSQRDPKKYQAAKEATPTPPKSPGLPALPFTRRKLPDVTTSPPGEETVWEQLLGPKLIVNEKLVKCTTNCAAQGQELILLLFGAKWRAECKIFYPLMIDFFKLMAHQHKMECVYISNDRTLMEFKDIFVKMPFLSLPTGTVEIKNILAQQLKVNDLPVLVVMTADGRVITTEGYRMVAALERRNEDQANKLVDVWKKAQTYNIDQVPADTSLKHGNLARGTVYWQA
uniref:protein-disulfide reductase n=1 Tax=Phaeodactylum tricornutum TaxID=2850 RepID=A0A8J9S8C3_PHATR